MFLTVIRNGSQIIYGLYQGIWLPLGLYLEHIFMDKFISELEKYFEDNKFMDDAFLDAD